MDIEKPNYYAVLPANIRYDDRLKPNEKLLYSEITALSNKTGLCYATNKYFANLYKVEIETVSRWIKNIKDLGYIDTEILHKEETKEIEKRIIKIIGIPIDKNVNTYIQKNQGGIDKKVKENNTSINKKENIKRKVFKKPTLEELEEYCKSSSLSVDVQYFYDYYESKGWAIGKSPMKNWQATLRNWSRRNQKEVRKPTVIREYVEQGVRWRETSDGKRIMLGVVLNE